MFGLDLLISHWPPRPKYLGTGSEMKRLTQTAHWNQFQDESLNFICKNALYNVCVYVYYIYVQYVWIGILISMSGTIVVNECIAVRDISTDSHK